MTAYSQNSRDIKDITNFDKNVWSQKMVSILCIVPCKRNKIKNVKHFISSGILFLSFLNSPLSFFMLIDSLLPSLSIFHLVFWPGMLPVEFHKSFSFASVRYDQLSHPYWSLVRTLCYFFIPRINYYLKCHYMFSCLFCCLIWIKVPWK
jgi:hypothetical protein